MAVPAITNQYGRASYWDTYEQQQAQGKNVSDKTLLNAAYGERYGELANEMNKQKINRDIAFKNEEMALRTNDQSFNQQMRREEMAAKDSIANKSMYGQIAGLGMSAALNWDKMSKFGSSLYSGGEKIYNWATGQFESPEWATPEGYNSALDWTNQGGNMVMDEAGNWVPDMASFGADTVSDWSSVGGDMVMNSAGEWVAEGAADAAASYSVPYFAIAKYGTYALDAVADANNIQALQNLTDPLSGAFRAFSEGLSAFFGADGIGNLFDW
jgi:hypothetical protein